MASLYRTSSESQPPSTYGASYGIARFDLGRTEVTAKSGDVSDLGIQELPNGWFRCWRAMPYATGEAVFNFALVTGNGVAPYAGDNLARLLVWGVQFEPGGRPEGYAAADGPAKR
jgi:hypothetical protein